MALNLKNREVEQLAHEVAQLTGESKTVAVLHALRERKQRLQARRVREAGVDDLMDFLAEEVWSIPSVPGDHSDDELLGFGEAGA